MITPAQCRAARALLNWSQGELALAAGVSRSTVVDFEAGKRDTMCALRDLMQKALEAAGIDIMAAADGVRFNRVQLATKQFEVTH